MSDSGMNLGAAAPARPSIFAPHWRVPAAVIASLAAILTYVGWNVDQAVDVAELMARPHELQATLERTASAAESTQDAVQDYVIDGVDSMRVQFEDSVRLLGRQSANLRAVSTHDLGDDEKADIGRRIDGFLKSASAVVEARNRSSAADLQQLMDSELTTLVAARGAIEKAMARQEELLQVRAASLRWHVVQVFGGLVASVAIVFWIVNILVLQSRNQLRRHAESQATLKIENERLRESERQRTEVLDRANQELATLSKRVLEIQEEDRRSIALELHDQIGQALSTLVHLLGRFQEDIEAGRKRPDQKRTLEQTLEIARTVYGDIHNLALELRPAMLDQLGLVPTLQWYTRQQARIARCAIQVDLDGSPIELPSDTLVTAFRIVQEAVSNATRHGRARHIRIMVRYAPERVELLVSDDGIGFIPSAANDPGRSHFGLGLIGMRQRASNAGGELSIESAPGQGTRILATLPVRSAAGESAAA